MATNKYLYKKLENKAPEIVTDLDALFIRRRIQMRQQDEAALKAGEVTAEETPAAEFNPTRAFLGRGCTRFQFDRFWRRNCDTKAHAVELDPIVLKVIQLLLIRGNSSVRELMSFCEIEDQGG